jgi:hypothetical protein
MSISESLAKAVVESPPAQFLRLCLARERGDHEEEREARDRLRRLGVKVTFAHGR